METLGQDIANWLMMYTGKIMAAAVIFIIGRWLCSKLASMLSLALERKKVDQTLVNFLKNIVYYALLVVVIISALNQLGIHTTSFLAIVIALAKEVLAQETRLLSIPAPTIAVA